MICDRLFLCRENLQHLCSTRLQVSLLVILLLKSASSVFKGFFFFLREFSGLVVGCADITSVALEWAKWNVESNPHVSALIEVRNAVLDSDTSRDGKEASISALDPALPPSEHESVVEEPQDSQSLEKELVMDSLAVGSQLPSGVLTDEIECSSECSPEKVPSELTIPSMVGKEPGYNYEPPSNAPGNNMNPGERSLGVLVGVVREEERFDFCMCNPPFFASMEEAGLNPRTACGGTEAEMVCPGGEEAFVAHIIADSAQLKHVIQCVSFYLIV